MTLEIPVIELLPNEGQVAGLPANPRVTSEESLSRLKKSLQDDPEMLRFRELLVYAFDGKYIVICGNARYRAALELGILEIPCKIIPPDTPVEKLRAYAIKDNVPYGEWDMTALSDDWDKEELESWGIDEWGDDPVDMGDFFAPSPVGGAGGAVKEKLCPHCGKNINEKP